MRRAYLGFAFAAAVACQDVDSSDSTREAIEEREDERPSSGGSKADASTGSKGSGKPDAAVADAGKSSAAKDAGKPSASKQHLPCDVKAALDSHCVSCHAADEPQFGAPMSLASVADFHAQSPRAKAPYYEASIDRIERTGKGAMPPSPQPPLPAKAKASLLAWLNEGAPSADEACKETSAPEVKPGSDAGKPMTGEPSADVDCDVSFELRAYEGDRKTKYPIPMEDDHYECFYFNASELGITAETLATSASPLIDDSRVLHHWLLFAADNEDEAPSGTHRKCDGIHPGAYLAAAWLPGTPALVLPKDVGMEMPNGKTAQFILENHYNNTARYQNASDNSGVKVCATNKPKTQHAAIHWLGSELITLLPNSSGSAMGTCTPNTSSSDPINILGVIPHMHRLGRHVNMTILRANGTKEVMHDANFEFENQTFFPKQVKLNPGDRVQTKCDYMNDTTGIVSLGEKTTQEMCYMFTLAYPVGRMNTGGDYRNPLTNEPFVQGPHRCMR